MTCSMSSSAEEISWRSLGRSRGEGSRALSLTLLPWGAQDTHASGELQRVNESKCAQDGHEDGALPLPRGGDTATRHCGGVGPLLSLLEHTLLSVVCSVEHVPMGEGCCGSLQRVLAFVGLGFIM